MHGSPPPMLLIKAGEGGGECPHCLSIKPEEVPPGFAPLSRREVGGAAAARSGVTGPGRR